MKCLQHTSNSQINTSDPLPSHPVSLETSTSAPHTNPIMPKSHKHPLHSAYSTS
ncbi:hypothetical protein BC829DRAFT_397999 [Chytridium lagenaria]|nr:hypothetical protein BC829DRAFT_397999 [Chytridium lagenaria]